MIQLPNTPSIVATVVKNNERLAFLPKYFGRYYLTGEAIVYSFMTKLSNTYTGGYWEFY